MDNPATLKTPGARLRWARAKKYPTAKAAAEAFNLPISTYAGHENGSRGYDKADAERYGARFGVPWAWLLGGGPLESKRSGKEPARSLAALTDDTGGAALLTSTIPITGEVAAGQWLDIDVEVDPRDLEQHPVAPHPGYPRAFQFGLIVRGTSLDKYAQPGTVLQCVDVIKADIEVLEGDVVIVQRTKHQEGLREVTAKKISNRGKMIVLSPDSTDPKWKPIEFDPDHGHDTDEEVRVLGLVIGRYIPTIRRGA